MASASHYDIEYRFDDEKFESLLEALQEYMSDWQIHNVLEYVEERTASGHCPTCFGSGEYTAPNTWHQEARQSQVLICPDCNGTGFGEIDTEGDD